MVVGEGVRGPKIDSNRFRATDQQSLGTGDELFFIDWTVGYLKFGYLAISLNKPLLWSSFSYD